MNTLAFFATIIAIALAEPLRDEFVSVNQDSLGNYNYRYGVNGVSIAETSSVKLPYPILRTIPEVPLVRTAQVGISHLPVLRRELPLVRQTLPLDYFGRSVYSPYTYPSNVLVSRSEHTLLA